MNEPELIRVAPDPFLLLNPADPAVLTGIIPGCETRRIGGVNVLAVPHTLDAVRVLRNLGAPAPSPISARYNWPGRYAPFAAQRTTAEFLTLNPRAFVLNEMGTGKTLATLWAADYLRSVGAVRRIFVLAPLSTLDTVWASEILMNFPHLRYTVLHSTRERRLKLLKEDFDVYIINHDGVKIVADEVAKRGDIDLVIVDELSAFRNASTDRFKALDKIARGPERRVWGLGATPTPNAPTDAWAQIRLVNPSAVPPYFKRFREQTMDPVTAFKWRPKPDAQQRVYDAMQPAIRFTRAQCVDLPETLYQTLHVPLSPEQQKAYDQLRTQLKLETDAGTARAVNQADMAMKLVQVACGAVRDSKTGDPLLLANTARVKTVCDVIEQAAGKVIVCVPFVAALEGLRDELAKLWPTELVYGATSRDERTRIFADFQHGGDAGPRVLVANPRVMSHGLTLTAADTMIWFAPTPSHETFDQTCHRIIRAGQRRSTLVVMIEGSPVERKLYRVLRERGDMQTSLLDMFDSEG